MIQNYFRGDQVTIFAKWLRWAKNFVILTHISPDGDAIGSSLAMAGYLKNKGKNVKVVVPNDFPDYYLVAGGAENIIVFSETKQYIDLISKTDVIVCLDFNETGRVGSSLQYYLIKSPSNKIMIDHHLNPQPFCDITLSVPSASSTCELVYNFICAMGDFQLIDLPIAQALFMGLMTDTGCFAYNCSNPDIYIIVNELLKLGVDRDRIYRAVNYCYSKDRMQLMGRALQNLKMYRNGNVSLMVLSDKELQKFNYHAGDSEGFVNLPLQISGVKMSVFIREDCELNQIKFSARSVGSVPCNQFMSQFFHGGGHLNAAGGELRCSLEQAISIFENAIKEWNFEF